MNQLKSLRRHAMRALFLGGIFMSLIPVPNAHANLPETFSDPDQFQVLHTHLMLTIDFDRKVLKGSANLKVQKLTESNLLQLDIDGLKVQKIEGDLESWKVVEPEGAKAAHLGEIIQIQTHPKKELQIVIHYETSPIAAGLVWMDANQTRSGAPFMFALGEAIGARSYFPCQDTPAIRGTYSADLRIVSKDHTGLMALVSGDNNPKQSNREMVYTGLISNQVTLPSYLFVLAAGQFHFESLDETIGFYADNKKTLSAAKEGFSDVSKYFAALQDMLGKTPWSSQDFLFLPAMFGYGGMENPRLIYINESLVEKTGSGAFVLAHELAHQWTGNVVTNDNWGDFWINEGWTSYYEDRSLEAVHGASFASNNAYIRYQTELVGKDEVAHRKSDHPVHSQTTRLNKKNRDGIHPDTFLDTSVYPKGATLLYAIEELVGRAEFDGYARRYVERFYLQPVNSESFIEFSVADLSSIRSDVNWNQFFRAWIYEIGVMPNLGPDLAPLGIPKGAGVQEALDTFQAQGMATNFGKWDVFQLQFLLEQIKRDLLNEPHQKQGIKHLRLLLTSSSFQKKIAPYTMVMANWYEVLVLGGLWTPFEKQIEEFLTENGRGRMITAIYKALFQETSDQKSRTFGEAVFKKNESRYFPSIRREIQDYADSVL